MISCFIIPWGDASDVCIHQSISSIILKNPVKGEGFHELIQEWDPLKFKSIQQKLWLERNQIQKHTLTAFESWKDVPEAPSGQPASRKSILSLQKYHIYIYKALTLSCKKHTHTRVWGITIFRFSLRLSTIPRKPTQKLQLPDVFLRHPTAWLHHSSAARWPGRNIFF